MHARRTPARAAQYSRACGHSIVIVIANANQTHACTVRRSARRARSARRVLQADMCLYAIAIELVSDGGYC